MWDVFISHASEDKEAVARPLAEELSRRGYNVWYDDLTLKIGDSLRRSIDRGLRDSRFGLVVLSPSFFRKEWPQRELDGFTSREANGAKVILPVWHKVTQSDVATYSPVLADRLGVSTSKGIEAVCNAIEQVLRESSSMSLHGHNVTPAEVREYAREKTKRSRQLWKELEHVSIPMLSDTKNSRDHFSLELAQALVEAYGGTSFERFTALFHVEEREGSEIKAFIYGVDCHHGKFTEALRRRGKALIGTILAAKVGGDPKLIEGLKEAASMNLMAFREKWSLDVAIEFSDDFSAIELILDPDTSRISIQTMPYSMNPADYRSRVSTTSEALQFIASTMRMPVAYLGDLGWYMKSYPLLKLIIDILDQRGVRLEALRIRADDCEEWDYDNPDFDVEIERFAIE
jgi:hypothetical protein